MKVQLTQKLDVDIVQYDFEISFAWKLKSGVSKDFWFTPTGKCKIFIGALHTNHLGQLAKGQYNKLMAMLKKGKCDILTDGRNYYTTGDNNLIELNNASQILYSANLEWDARKYVEYWVEDDRTLN